MVYLPNFLLLQAIGSPQNSLHLPKKLALCQHGEAQQPDWAQTESSEELQGQQQSETIHLLMNSQEKPELPNSSITCFC